MTLGIRAWTCKKCKSLRHFETMAGKILVYRMRQHFMGTREQIRQLNHTNEFTTVVDGKRYTIRKAGAHNITCDEGRRYCVVFKDGRMPLYDLMLAQKLLLETAPEQFHKLANIIEPQRAAG